MESLRKCFLCAIEFVASGSRSRDNLSITESSFMLNEVLELPQYDVDDITDTDTDKNDRLRLKFQSACYCSKCLEIITNLSSLAVELEILKEKVSAEKRNIIGRLRQSRTQVSERITPTRPPGMLQLLRNDIISEMDKEIHRKKMSFYHEIPFPVFVTGTGGENNLMSSPDDASDLNMKISYFKKLKNVVEPTVVDDPLRDTDVESRGIDTEADGMEVPEMIQNSYICVACDDRFDYTTAPEIQDSARHTNKNKSPVNAEQNITKKRKKTVRSGKKRDRTTRVHHSPKPKIKAPYFRFSHQNPI